MSDVTTGAEAPSGSPIAPANIQTDTGPISLRDAARSLGARREKGEAAGEAEDKPEPKLEQPREKGRFASAAAPHESAPDGGDAGPEKVPGETVEIDPAELPPIEPPRSWSKEDKALFADLPRETQERLSERERSRESDFLKRQNEAAEKTKALTAKEQAAEQARTQYEQAAQNALQVLNRQQTAEFADIKTQADVEKLATDDPFRFAQWQARQMAISAQAQEVENLNRQRQEESRKTFEAWSKEQDDKFAKDFPEFNDKEKAPKVREAVTGYLTNVVGVPSDALPNLWNNPLFRDAMMQRVIYDASRFHAGQEKAKAAARANLPSPQRPGTAPARGEAKQADIAVLETKLAKASGTRNQIAAAAALHAARRVAR